jgi:hypothetical protein
MENQFIRLIALHIFTYEILENPSNTYDFSCICMVVAVDSGAMNFNISL